MQVSKPSATSNDDGAGAERGQLAAVQEQVVLADADQAAARPPNACESAVRCGTAVSGTHDSGTPTIEPSTIAMKIQV